MSLTTGNEFGIGLRNRDTCSMSLRAPRFHHFWITFRACLSGESEKPELVGKCNFVVDGWTSEKYMPW